MLVELDNIHKIGFLLAQNRKFRRNNFINSTVQVNYHNKLSYGKFAFPKVEQPTNQRRQGSIP